MGGLSAYQGQVYIVGVELFQEIYVIGIWPKAVNYGVDPFNDIFVDALGNDDFPASSLYLARKTRYLTLS